MTAILGKILLFCGCTYLGLDHALQRKRRTACLQAFRQALASIGRELTFSLRPVSDLLARAAQQDGPVGAFFAACGQHFITSGGESWSDSWTAALETVPLPLQDADRRLLTQAGDILGRYDGENQRQALETLLSQLSAAAGDAAEEEKRLFRVDLALGVTAGLFCVILL